MKTNKINFLGVLAGILLLICLAIISCKKEDDSSTPLTAAETAISQDAEAQDAIADDIEQKIDNSLDKIIENDFSTLKAGDACYTINVSPAGSDTTTASFPKTVTISYDCKDTINGEILTLLGQVSVKVELMSPTLGTGFLWKNRIKRTITFSNFGFSTDSSSLVINGTRVMKRLSNTISLNAAKDVLRGAAKDSITSNLTFKINYNGLLKDITRKVAKVRNAIIYLKKATVGDKAIWRHDLKNDTVVFTGKVTGVNAKGDDYSRTIAIPVKFTFCPYWPYNPIISEGKIDFVSGTETFAITYAADACKTKVSISKDGKSKEFVRGLKLKFRTWW